MAVADVYVLNDILSRPEDAGGELAVVSDRFRRTRFHLPDASEVLLDSFPDFPGACCIFARLSCGEERVVRLVVRGVDALAQCPAGGWLLRRGRGEPGSAGYWIPKPPSVRTIDVHGRILSQQPADVIGFGGTPDELWADVRVPKNRHLDITAWRLPELLGAQEALESPLAVERQPTFLRSSHAVLHGPADVYLCLVHGHVYDNRFVWRRIWGGFRWRICSENEAFSLYVALSGLERATGRRFYTLLKRQVLYSVIARQPADGGWRHGEWTDLMESHFRLHNAGVAILEAALDEAPDRVVSESLERAVAFSASRSDRTDVGLWFLHDSLEESVEMATAEGAPPWTPTRVLGATASNKLILNTHLDAIVVLDRYRAITGDTRHVASVNSARDAARAVLAMRPAEALYRLAYRAVRLTLLPAERAKHLSLPVKALRRLARERLNPNLYRLKARYPRFVMPGGLLDRHLSPRHFDMGYHPVNLMDVVRVARRFPEDDFGEIVSNAVDVVTRTGLLQFWMESKHRQPIGYWVEALYHLCTLDAKRDYRSHLAEAMLLAEDAGLGLPPALLGADPEAVPAGCQVPCPSARDSRLRVANLSRKGCVEFLVVNPAADSIPLAWESTPPVGTVWSTSDDRPLAEGEGTFRIPPRGWVLGLAP